MTRLGMLIDLKRCIGCDACTIACKQEQGTPPDVMFARVFSREYGKFPNTKKFFLPILCNHCEDPPCMKACPSHAIQKRKDGIVFVDEDKCCGAQACVGACPYGAIYYPAADSLEYFDEATELEKYQFQRKIKLPVAMKCNFCAPRLEKGMEPACVVTCPTGCRIFGDLDDQSSKPNVYLRERTPNETPFPLRPEAGTKPNVLYLK
jgi:phenylacetyl-CoA:acceptor oxidoreductase 27-kDa subunit